MNGVFLCCQCGITAPNTCPDDVWRAADAGWDVIGAGGEILYRRPLHRFGPTDTIFTAEVKHPSGSDARGEQL